MKVEIYQFSEEYLMTDFCSKLFCSNECDFVILNNLSVDFINHVKKYTSQII